MVPVLLSGCIITENSTAIALLWLVEWTTWSCWTVNSRSEEITVACNLSLHTVLVNFFARSHILIFGGKCDWNTHTVELCLQNVTSGNSSDPHEPMDSTTVSMENSVSPIVSSILSHSLLINLILICNLGVYQPITYGHNVIRPPTAWPVHQLTAWEEHKGGNMGCLKIQRLCSHRECKRHRCLMLDLNFRISVNLNDK